MLNLLKLRVCYMKRRGGHNLRDKASADTYAPGQSLRRDIHSCDKASGGGFVLTEHIVRRMCRGGFQKGAYVITPYIYIYICIYIYMA